VGSSHRSFTHTIPWFRHRSFTEHPNGVLQSKEATGWIAQ
jgi:hypothetical protein